MPAASDSPAHRAALAVSSGELPGTEEPVTDLAGAIFFAHVFPDLPDFSFAGRMKDSLTEGSKCLLPLWSLCLPQRTRTLPPPGLFARQVRWQDTLSSGYRKSIVADSPQLPHSTVGCRASGKELYSAMHPQLNRNAQVA